MNLTYSETVLDIETFVRFLTFAIFVLAGFDLSKNVPMPKHIVTWILLVFTTIVAAYIGIHVAIISLFGYGIYLNMVLLGLCCGFIAGFILRIAPRIKARFR
jgi:hypothetical protein